MISPRNAIRVTAVAAIALVTLVCASPPPPAVVAGSASGVPAATIEIKQFTFSSDKVTITRGQSVRFVNVEDTNHTVTSGADRKADGKFDHKFVGRGDFTVTFNAAGAYEYFCEFHGNMVAAIEVR